MKIVKSATNSCLYSLLVMLIILLTSQVSHGQTSTIKTNLANLAISGGSVHYEHVIGESSTAQLGVFMTALSVDDTKFSGFGIIPQYRFYPGSNHTVPHGFFVAPLISYQTFSLETNSAGLQNAEADYSLIGAGVDIGTQWLINRSFSLELSAGVSFNSTNLDIKTSGADDNDFSIDNFGSTTPRLGVSVGYAF